VLYVFVGSEPLHAGKALTAAPDRSAASSQAGIDDLVFDVITGWTAHGARPGSVLELAEFATGQFDFVAVRISLNYAIKVGPCVVDVALLEFDLPTLV